MSSIRDLPLFSMLRDRMRWHNQRQAVLAENVANADTPGFRGRDLRPLTFGAANGAMQPQRTDGQHMTLSGARDGRNQPQRAGSFETTPRGNAVVLEDEMLRITQNQQDFQAAASVYQRGLGILRMATGRRGG